jgi:voltage-gated potassium channel
MTADNTDNFFDKLRDKLHEVIFEADTPAGKLFDLLLIVCIGVSVILVMLDSVALIQKSWGKALYIWEWFFTLLFTVEYILRLVCVRRPILYATSFFGIVDLLAILPTYFSVFFPGSQYLLVIRILRVLRIFRVFKLVQYVSEAKLLIQALRASRRKITVFIFTVFTMVIIFGCITQNRHRPGGIRHHNDHWLRYYRGANRDSDGRIVTCFSKKAYYAGVSDLQRGGPRQ